MAKILGLNAAFLMGRRPRDSLHSWVANQMTRLPTGYTEAQMHPALLERDPVLFSANDLDTWLSRPS